MTKHAARRSLNLVLSWFDTGTPLENATDDRRIEWVRVVPFLLLHLGCLLVLITGVSTTALLVCLGLYAVRMFAITAFYHRYFSHRAFRASRAWQLVFAVLGASAAQRGPLWWAAHHRRHHKHADTERDAHSAHQRGRAFAHMGWFMTAAGHHTDFAQVRDFASYPELRFLDRFDGLVPLLLMFALFGAGEVLAVAAPGLGTDGWQLVAWGFFVSTTVLFHVTSLVNSVGHSSGSRRYATKDLSRNSLWLALLTFGEGWHNNHHHYPVSVRQGFFWWEIDLTWYLLEAMAALGLVHDLRPVPERVRNARLPR